MRQLKHHESKLLKKVDFYSWKSEGNIREATVIRKYRLQRREDYIAYNRMIGQITKLVAKFKSLPTFVSRDGRGRGRPGESCS